MREYSKNDLFRLTQAELLRLDHEMVIALSSLPELSELRTIALLNQHRIRRQLGRYEI